MKSLQAAKTLLFLLTLMLAGSTSRGEGIKQLMPDSNVSASGLYLYSSTAGAYTRFAMQNCPAAYRLNIHVSNPGETILFGLQATTGMTYNLRNPSGAIVKTGACPNLSGQQGYITYYNQAVKGPFPSVGGYVPLSYQVTSIADTGDYYFEFSFTYLNVIIDLWDFQVVSGQHTPALPADTLNGRVWSASWQLYADLGNFVFQPFNGRFFVYSDDGIVTKLKFSDAHVGAMTVFCNPWGCYNTGNFTVDRQSVNVNTYMMFPGIAKYKVFLNNPDTVAYPDGSFGHIIGTPYMIPDPGFPPCSPEKVIVVEVDKAGTVETSITLPYGAPTTNVDFYTSVTAGINYIPWNGKDGLGNTVPDGTLITVMLNYVNGLTNLPIWDQERNPDGYQISLVRPAGGSVTVPATYHDDSQLNNSAFMCPVVPVSVNLTGCLPGSQPPYPGCHVWGVNAPDCHDKMINTWWYSGSGSAMFTAVFSAHPASALAHDSTRCGPGTVLLHATVPPGQTVDWYDSLSGGSLLLSGDTSFLTPVLTAAATYYAEARDSAGNCYSLARSPATAYISPLVVPTMTGPAYVCAGAEAFTYSTQQGMLNYSWSITPPGIILSGQGTNSVQVQWPIPGDGTVRVNFENPNGCVSPEPASIHVSAATPPGPAGPVSGPSPLCTGDSLAVFSIQPVPGASSYVWAVPAGCSIHSGNGTNAITLGIGPGMVQGLISVFAMNFCGQGLPSPPFMLQVNPAASVFAGDNTTLCRGEPLPLQTSAASGAISLLWTSSGSGSFSDPTSLHPVYYPSTTDTGTLVLTLTGTPLPPCPESISSLILNYISGPSGSAGGDAQSCGRSAFTIQNSSAVSYQGLQWETLGSGTFSSAGELHPVYYPSAGDVANGEVTLVLRLLANPPCPGTSDSMRLSLGSLPFAEAGPGGILCNEESFAVTGASAVGYSSLKWTHDGKGRLEADATLKPLYYPAAGETGNVRLILQVYGLPPCGDSAAVSGLTLQLLSAPEAAAGPDQEIPDSGYAVLQGSASGGSGNYLWYWEPASLLLDARAQSPVTRPLYRDTTFYLTVGDSLSECKGSDQVRITVKRDPPPPPPPPETDCIRVPNVITPNGDGINDRLFIDCIENYPDNSLQIFTRWGVRIRSFEGYNNQSASWDGTNDKGEPMPDGTYYYVLSAKVLGTRTGWIFIRDGRK